MKNNKKGEILLEFIFLIPIVVMICFVVYDIYNVKYNKLQISNIINDVEKMYQNDESVSSINAFINKNVEGADLVITLSDTDTVLSIEKEVKLMTPGVRIFITNPYKVIISKTIV